MAIEYISIGELKSKTSAKSSSKEITYDSVRDSIFEQSLANLDAMHGNPEKTSILKQDKNSSKTWYLILKYGVVPISGAKVTADSKQEAVKEAKAWLQKVKNNTAGVAVKKDIENAVVGKKNAVEKSRKKNEEKKAKIAAMSATERAAYEAERQRRREERKQKKNKAA